ncbi:HlyD family secretion protein [Ferrimonas marina]|uniref:Membrane fusion protein n=1 Tax=Ferrimonas marina TaxID=299255 RepID=A0A1M5ZAF3_9GAMM|nr:HlyD family efflux transporter periplasmic adaptor subunit [Ferrimonas marina]SHI21118.1 membrane fusion protein [Ferrimonas marina]
MGLFRQQAVEAQQQKLLGTVVLSQPRSLQGLSYLLLALLLLSLTFLANAHYARKETVSGFLNPDKGLIKVTATRAGVVETLLVKAGQQVEKDQALAVLVLKRNLASGGELNEKTIAQLEQQLHWLDEQMSQRATLLQQDTRKLEDQRTRLLAAETNLQRQYQLLLDKVSLIQQQEGRFEQLHRQGYLSELDLQTQQERLLAARQELEQISAQQVQLESDLRALGLQLQRLPVQHQLQRSDDQVQRAAMQQRLDEARSNHRFVVRATTAGTISALHAIEGEQLNGGRSLMSLIPQDAILVAELLLPSRSAGFVQLGDTAKLRFDAFPYQRFGFVEAQIIRVDKSLLVNGDQTLPIAPQEPVYRLKAKLTQQSILAYGKHFPLKAGMQLEADIQLDRRSLLQWLLDPIYSLQGRIG